MRVHTHCITHQVSWKVPADCVEALLAACLLEAGETAPQSLLKWLNLPILKGYTSSSSTTNRSSNDNNSSSCDSSGSPTGSSFLDTGIVSSFVTPTKAPVVTAGSTASTDNSDAMDVEDVHTEPTTATTTSNVNSSDQQQQQSSAATAASTEAVTEVVTGVVKEKKVRYNPAVHITTPSEWALKGRPGLTVTSLECQLQALPLGSLVPAEYAAAVPQLATVQSLQQLEQALGYSFKCVGSVIVVVIKTLLMVHALSSQADRTLAYGNVAHEVTDLCNYMQSSNRVSYAVASSSGT
eukprot:11611-Heterococcus_DN1.PRE.1